MTEMGGDGVKVEFEAIGGKDGQAALERLPSGPMAIVIAHQLSTIHNADVICVVQDRQIVERGKHEELLALDGVIARFTSGSLSAPRPPHTALASGARRPARRTSTHHLLSKNHACGTL